MRRLPEQQSIYNELPPVREGSPLFCHQEFLEKMEENRSSTVGRRAALLMQRLLVDLNRQYFKSTQGQNRGWRRSPLGGNHGFHYYAWWAPRGAAPLKLSEEFEATPEGSVFLRDVRHHDDHSLLNAQSLGSNYLPISVSDLRREEYVPAPWTTGQAHFANARQNIRIIKGFPGSGKTTALWHAADRAGRKDILYITYSKELAALARDHFNKFAPGNKRFHVVTYSQFLRELLGADLPFEPVRRLRTAFVKEISALSPTILGPWSTEKAALYDELHAHYVGATLPFPIGRFAGFPDRRITARQYRDVRERSTGRPAAEAAVEVADTLRRRDPHALDQRFFAELDLAWQAVQHLRSTGAGPFAEFDCIALDEAQDLTPIESLAIVELAARIKDVHLLVAGDEAQTVRPTDFEWGWFQDLVHHRLTSPAEFKLEVNLRSPRRIATLVNRVWELYGAIAKHERPSGTGAAEIDENAGDQVIYCTAKAGPDLDELLQAFSLREGLAVITMGDEIPAYVPETLRERVLTAFEAKGLDFQSVCVLDAGKWLDRIFKARERGRGVELDDLTKRLAIDQLRVSLSRPSERLYWLDVNPNDEALNRARKMLSFGMEPASPLVPAVLLKSLEEESLDSEERVRLCENDARQLLEIKPAMAWSRARQAVALLGDPTSKFAVTDPAARLSAYTTFCQVAFTLAFRKTALPSEVGRLDLYDDASRAAEEAGKKPLATLIRRIASHERNYGIEKLPTLFDLVEALGKTSAAIEPWLLVELQTKGAEWMRAVEDNVQTFAPDAIKLLEPLYTLFDPAHAAARSAELRNKVIRVLVRQASFGRALALLQEMPDPDRRLIAECREGLGELEAAAADYLAAGNPKEALRCYRSVPNFEKSLELLASVEDHPARESLMWLSRLRDLAAERPAEFNKVMLPAEKKILESVLETGLGVTRKKPAARKAATPKPKVPKKPKAPASAPVKAPVTPPVKPKRYPPLPPGFTRI